MTDPTLADCIEQIEYLTRIVDALRGDLVDIKAPATPERDPDVVRLAAMIPRGWAVSGIHSLTVPLMSVVRDCVTGEWSRWRGSVCEARGTLEEVTSD